MKQQVTVWTLSWDNRSGTDCRVFGTREEWFRYFCEIIETTIEGVETQEANEIRSFLAAEDIGAAYELWQESYKPDLDTYNWDSQSLVVEISDAESRKIA
jgi:hypothetical protein